jgi:hypothetical protein
LWLSDHRVLVTAHIVSSGLVRRSGAGASEHDRVPSFAYNDPVTNQNGGKIMFDGLYAYEIVLLILGVVLFLCSLAILVRAALRNRRPEWLLPYFGIACVMIAFPGISIVKINNGLLEIQKYTDSVERNPSDTKAKDRLRAAVGKLETRPLTSPESHMTFASAYAALGKENRAERHLDDVLSIQPARKDALTLRKTLKGRRTLSKSTVGASRLAKTPADVRRGEGD